MYETFLTFLAQQERDDAIEWFTKESPAQARNWLDEFDRLLDRLENNPFQYAEHLLFIRRAKLHKFPYHVFYAVDEINYSVEIIGIQHTSRDPNIIRRRINFE
ncbi:type II toxin-antitoxin system RelE/ParE family toxin [Spirosoma montaniterrae]|uniref:Plasmid stabilization protein n=1 Tax=Spirosoma montaniterrae TaxID=1178516 RepID=A0A1P9WZK5_9BACT|nr:type II toxin-antitoxin system RelE/ParE family toxin [Spirosoma montaniterrae]AQG80810.1 hypothetical protein AWR27_16685 [Spirosoma montaniterrae]